MKDEEALSAKGALLEKQLITLEDELSEAKLEASKLKTELVSEKSAWEVKLSEMQSRINEVKPYSANKYNFNFFFFCRRPKIKQLSFSWKKKDYWQVVEQKCLV